MGISTQIRYGLARMLVKASGMSVVSPWVRSTFLTPTFNSLVRDGYQKNAAVVQVLSALIFAFSEPPVRVWAADSRRAKVLPDHPLRKLLRRPNPIMGEDELMQYTIAYMGLGGNAYWVTGRMSNGKPAAGALWPYHAGQVRPIPGGEQWIKGYEFFNADGYWETIDAEKYIVTHFKWPLPDPTQPWIAQPPLRAVAAAVDTDNELDTYLYSLLKNDAVPRVLIKLPAGREMQKPEKDRLREQWSSMYGGGNRGGVAILDDGAGVERMGLSLEELAFDALRKIPEARIAGAFRVPPIVAGLNVGLDNATYSNYGQARTAFTQDTLVPLWRLVAAEIESSLGTLYGTISVRHDLNDVASLQEDASAKWERVDRAWNSGYIQLNEARRAIGYEDQPGGDVYRYDPSVAFVPAAEIGSGGVITLPMRDPAQLPDQGATN